MNQIKIEVWPIAKLVPYARAMRRNDDAVDRMVATIQEFSFRLPLLIRGDGEIVDGHLRLKAARKLGFAELPVIVCDDWTAAQVKAFRLAVNRSATWAQWDWNLVAQEIADLKLLDFDLTLTGFDGLEIDKLLLQLNSPDGDDFTDIDVQAPVSCQTQTINHSPKRQSSTSLPADQRTLQYSESLFAPGGMIAIRGKRL